MNFTIGTHIPSGWDCASGASPDYICNGCGENLGQHEMYAPEPAHTLMEYFASLRERLEKLEEER